MRRGPARRATREEDGRGLPLSGQILAGRPLEKLRNRENDDMNVPGDRLPYTRWRVALRDPARLRTQRWPRDQTERRGSFGQPSIQPRFMLSLHAPQGYTTESERSGQRARTLDVDRTQRADRAGLLQCSPKGRCPVVENLCQCRL